MRHFFLGYRHGNGEVEGFSATRFNEQRAEAACIAAIREKVSHTPFEFDESRIIRAEGDCTPAEFEIIRNDWGIVANIPPTV